MMSFQHNKAKIDESNQIKKQTKEFLANGGRIRCQKKGVSGFDAHLDSNYRDKRDKHKKGGKNESVFHGFQGFS